MAYTVKHGSNVVAARTSAGYGPPCHTLYRLLQEPPLAGFCPQPPQSHYNIQVHARSLAALTPQQLMSSAIPCQRLGYVQLITNSQRPCCVPKHQATLQPLSMLHSLALHHNDRILPTTHSHTIVYTTRAHTTGLY